MSRRQKIYQDQTDHGIFRKRVTRNIHCMVTMPKTPLRAALPNNRHGVLMNAQRGGDKKGVSVRWHRASLTKERLRRA